MHAASSQGMLGDALVGSEYWGEFTLSSPQQHVGRTVCVFSGRGPMMGMREGPVHLCETKPVRGSREVTKRPP